MFAGFAIATVRSVPDPAQTYLSFPDAGVMGAPGLSVSFELYRPFEGDYLPDPEVLASRGLAGLREYCRGVEFCDSSVVEVSARAAVSGKRCGAFAKALGRAFPWLAVAGNSLEGCFDDFYGSVRESSAVNAALNPLGVAYFPVVSV